MDSRLIRVFRAKVEEAIQTQAGLLIDGTAQDLAAYREAVGMVRGLRDALLLLEEADREITGDR